MQKMRRSRGHVCAKMRAGGGEIGQHPEGRTESAERKGKDK